MSTLLHKQLTKAIETYTERKVLSIETHEDRVGAIAVKVNLEGDQYNDVHFLVAAYDTDKIGVKHPDTYLEECQFTSWPPTEGPLRFFI